MIANQIKIREFTSSDIPKKVAWINDPENNRYLHYDLPLEESKTAEWWEKNKFSETRFDGIIEVNDNPVGLIGLLNIENGEAEAYICVDHNYKGNRIATESLKKLISLAKANYDLKLVYSLVEENNIASQKAFRNAGFAFSEVLYDDIQNNGQWVNRIKMNFSLKEKMGDMGTPVYSMGDFKGNHLYIKREDFIPFSFGGNKARKAKYFQEDMQRKKSECIVTYGSSHSNHCRVISNLAASQHLPCYIVTPEEDHGGSFNLDLVKGFGATIIKTPVENVSKTIDSTLDRLKNEGRNPYFIPGGGHGNLGTQAYIDCYEEILEYEKRSNIQFDYIFFASGTGTTQAGLILGKILNHHSGSIIGISIARKVSYGRNVVISSIKDYREEYNLKISDNTIEENTIFIDKYIEEGYGESSTSVKETISEMMKIYGLPLDETYTGKAFWGMTQYIKEFGLEDKNILFIHTGGTPLFFDVLRD